MAQLVDADEIDYPFFSSSKNAVDEELIEQWEEIESLPTFERSRVCLFDEEPKGKRVIDIRQLGASDRHRFVERLIKQIEADNLQLLQKIKKRTDRVGIKSPTVEVRYKNLCVEAKCKVVDGKPLPTLWKSLKSSLSVLTKLVGCQSQEAKISIVQDVSGIIKPGRLTLLLGPPGCGKTSLLLALSGNLNKSLKVVREQFYFLEECGFRCPPRKGVADFLQEVISRKDQWWLMMFSIFYFVCLFNYFAVEVLVDLEFIDD